MNVLSLRINGVKTDEGHKKQKTDLLAIEVEDFWASDVKEQLDLINLALKTEHQIREIRKLAQMISPEASEEQNRQITKKLVRIFFDKRVKHPAKASIQSCLNNSQLQDLITECIRDEIAARIVSIDFNETEATCHLAELDTELSPSQKSEVAFQLHSAIQAVIFCIRTYLKGVKSIDKKVKTDLDEISAWCEKFLDHPDLPMDSKNNCAMLIVMQSKLMLSSTYISWIRSDDSSSAKKLSLIFGVVNTLTAEDFNLRELAEVSVILKTIYQRSSVDPSLMLSTCRSFMQLTRKVASFGVTRNSPDLDTLTTCALAVAFLNLEHHLDSIRHLSRETLNNAAQLSEKLDDGTLSNRIFEEISNISTTNMQALVVIAISQSVPTDKILDKLTGLPKSLLESLCDNKVTNHNIANCFETLAMKRFNDIAEDAKQNPGNMVAGLDHWFDQFFSPVFDALHKSETGSEKRAILEDLLKRFLRKDRKIFEKAFDHSDSWNIEVVMLCLSAGKKSGYFDGVESTASHWKGRVKFSDIKSAMVKSDDSIRSSALMLVAESRKITDGFTPQEFDCIMHFLRYNVNVQSPSSRQAILGMTKSIFVRINAVLQLLTKKKAEINTPMGEKEKIDENLRFYQHFLVNLHDFCLHNLFEGANFTRRTLSLRLMFYNTEVLQKYFPEQATGVWDQKKFDVLMNVLNDSFEANKEMAIEIMTFIPRPVIQQFCKISLPQLKTMVTSIKPPDSLTATYLMEIYVKFTFDFKDFPNESPEVSPESLLMLTWCENLILEGLVVADKSLIVASSTNPLYGLVQCISRLLSKLDLKTLVDCQPWRDFFERLLVLCRRLTLAVAPVVNNSSPEGILPVEEIEGVDEATRQQWDEIVEQTTPQIILLCSWRTIKEVSLLLGDICLRVPVMNGQGAGLISVNQMLDIGDHFLELLSKTKHRGAFEQCFFGFSQLCLRLWTCHEPELHKLPSEMLHQMISSISGDEKENNELLSMKNLCATRRSAGLPFMIQALITSELKVSTNKNFHYVMKSLVKFCKEGEYLETRTHSLNILRALFRCSDLNVEIGEYIAEGMKCAILGYGADSWIERNSSTLLFSALMVRIFGVQRTKDSEDLSVKNRMTGRIFFLRYPELYDFIMEQLEEAADFVNAIQMNAKLHPLLLLLIRLYPSALEGNATKLELTGFLPVVTRCSGCVEMQTRILCAKFIANVTPPEFVVKRIYDSSSLLRNIADMPANVKHGILLQILYLTKTLNRSSFEQDLELISVMNVVFGTYFQFKQQIVCLATFFDIMIESVTKVWPLVKDQGEGQNNALISIYMDCCFDMVNKSPAIFGTPLLEQRLYLMKLVQCLLDKKKIFSSSLPALIRTKILHADYNYAVGMQDEYEIDTKAILFMKEDCLRVPMRLMPDNELKAVLVNATTDGSYYLRVMAFDALSLTRYEKGDRDVTNIKKLIESAMVAPDQMKMSMLKYANVCIAGEECFAEIDFKFLLEVSTDASYFVKSSASNLVESIASRLHELFGSMESLLYFSRSLLVLLMDDEEPIREKNARVVARLTGYDENVLPIFAQELFIDFLLQSSVLSDLDDIRRTALVMLIVVNGADGENSLNEGILEYQVFDKSEINIFSEALVVKEYCTKALQEKLRRVPLECDGTGFLIDSVQWTLTVKDKAAILRSQRQNFQIDF